MTSSANYNSEPTKKESKTDETKMHSPLVQLNTGHMMPIYGYGTYKMHSIDILKYAISIGYRTIDTAINYKNEELVGEAIASVISDGSISRSDLFIITKLWSDGHESGSGNDKTTYNAVQMSLKKLGLEYIDLYLIHSPHGGQNIATYKELLKLQKSGELKSVGVSNYGVAHLQCLEDAGLPMPAVNQIELHPWLQQKTIVQYCKKKGIIVQSYSPLTKGKQLKNILNMTSDEGRMIGKLAEKYGKSAAQILLKWNVQTQPSVVVKSAQKSRVLENFSMWDWTIDDADIVQINGLENDYHCTWDPTTMGMNSF